MSDPMQGNNKAYAAALAGALVVILAWVLDLYKIPVTTEVSSAFQTIFTVGFVYFVPHGNSTKE